MNHQEEYNEFMSKLAFKAHEVQQDYDALSEENKKRVIIELNDVITDRGTVELLNQLASRRCNL